MYLALKLVHGKGVKKKDREERRGQNSVDFNIDVLSMSFHFHEKSFIPKKKYFLSRFQYQNKKALFTGSILREGLAVEFAKAQSLGL